MAMTKVEKAYQQSLEDELLLYKAFTRTPLVIPDIEPPTVEGELHKGWIPLVKAKTITDACTTLTSHSLWSSTKTDSQGSRHLYSTRLLALKALRNELEKEFMLDAARIDKLIAKEQL